MSESKPAPKIEITPEMVEAGAAVISDARVEGEYSASSDSAVAVAVYSVMRQLEEPARYHFDQGWRHRVAAAMCVEFTCLLEAWEEGDEEEMHLSPEELARRVYLSLSRVAQRAPSPASPLREMPKQN